MILGFPNRSRSFDKARNAVRFSGYDGMLEVSFFVEAAALIRATDKFGKPMTTEAECLAGFDSARDAIQRAAAKAYSKGRRGTGNIYTLTAVDLR
jgi:hypothetical protein